MDFSKIFLKEACPTSIGGQALIEGIMMRGEDRTAVAVRLPDGGIHLKTEKLPPKSKLTKVPILRGVISFGSALVYGTKTLMYSAEVLENYESKQEEKAKPSEDGDQSKKNLSWTLMLYFSVAVALAFSIGVFVVLPTVVVNFCNKFTENEILLNLIEGVFRIILFILYILAISKMEDIKRVFQFHGAEHKCIHCFENNLELTPENCKPFYTLHPRCGTSFLMFVMVISLILFSLLGWPDLWLRISSRLVLIPVIAGLSYELLKWAGRSSSLPVKITSMPGLYLQKLTTKEPERDQLEVAIVAMKAVMVPEETTEILTELPGYESYTQEVFLGKGIV